MALAKTLLNRGADPNAEGLDSDSLLILAVRGGHLELVKLLLERAQMSMRRQEIMSLALRLL